MASYEIGEKFDRGTVGGGASANQAGGPYLTRAELVELGEADRMAYLREQWSLDEDVLYGRLTQHEVGVWIITGATNAAGQPLEYPVEDLEQRFEELQSWVHVGGKPGGCEPGDKVRGAFTLAPEEVRKKRSNPLAIGVAQNSVEVVREITASDLRFQEDGALNVSETLARQYVEVAHAEALREVERLREERDTIIGGFSRLKQKKREAAEALAATEEAVAGAEQRKKRVLRDVEEEAKERRREIEDALAARKTAMEREIEQEKAIHQRTIDEMAHHAERLRDYVKGQAERLCRLDLITEEQRRELTADPDTDLEDVADLPTPASLPGGWADVVPRVQRYLVEERGVVYPRALLEAYLALVLAGDLVVLSGLSGSGKTQLVRAFAHATGGVPHVVPVKPNWTSSEDLLGYYNPIQRAYLTTPFLDALIAAKRDPGRIHYVCLDEMNLARVEYYFADFLSAMETRGASRPTVQLYSDEEAGHVTAEFRAFVDVVMDVAGDAEELSLGELLSEGDLAARLHERLGLGDGESLVELHGRLRRMVSGVLNVPSELAVPANVRIVGAVNVDETTHSLAPKVLDRAHVLRFGSPLDVWDRVVEEVEAAQDDGVPGERVFLPAELLHREEYPDYDPRSDDPVVQRLSEWRADYFVPLGLDFGLRTARQALQFKGELARVTGAEGEELGRATLVHILRQKVLPRFSFDGSQPPRPKPSGELRPEGEKRKLDTVKAFARELAALGEVGPYAVQRDLETLVAQADSDRAGGIFTYWS